MTSRTFYIAASTYDAFKYFPRIAHSFKEFEHGCVFIPVITDYFEHKIDLFENSVIFDNIDEAMIKPDDVFIYLVPARNDLYYLTRTFKKNQFVFVVGPNRYNAQHDIPEQAYYGSTHGQYGADEQLCENIITNASNRNIVIRHAGIYEHIIDFLVKYHDTIQPETMHELLYAPVGYATLAFEIFGLLAGVIPDKTPAVYHIQGAQASVMWIYTEIEQCLKKYGITWKDFKESMIQPDIQRQDDTEHPFLISSFCEKLMTPYQNLRAQFNNHYRPTYLFERNQFLMGIEEHIGSLAEELSHQVEQNKIKQQQKKVL